MGGYQEDGYRENGHLWWTELRELGCVERE